MEIIEYFPCSCVEELEDREAWYITNHESVNDRLPGAYRRAGGERAYKKQQYQDNAEVTNAKRRQCYQDNPEARKTYEYQRYQDNAETIKARRRQLYQQDVCKKVLHGMITQLEDEHRHTTDNTVDEYRRAPTTPHRRHHRRAPPSIDKNHTVAPLCNSIKPGGSSQEVELALVRTRFL
jgi:hypothetical protein